MGTNSTAIKPIERMSFAKFRLAQCRLAECPPILYQIFFFHFLNYWLFFGAILQTAEQPQTAVGQMTLSDKWRSAKQQSSKWHLVKWPGANRGCGVPMSSTIVNCQIILDAKKWQCSVRLDNWYLIKSHQDVLWMNPFQDYFRTTWLTVHG